MNILGINTNFECESSASNVIYKISFAGTDKVYIGQTTLALKSRIYGHIYDAIKNRNSPLRKAIRKYKELTVNILCECSTIDELNVHEKNYILQYNSVVPNGYNIEEGGNNSKLHSRTKASISKSMKLKYEDAEFLNRRKHKQSEVSKQMWQNDEYKSKMSNSLKEKWDDKQYREKVLSKLLSARLKCCKCIHQYTTDLKYIATYDNGPSAALSNNLSYNQSKNILFCAKQNEGINSGYKKCYGFIWSYVRLDR